MGLFANLGIASKLGVLTASGVLTCGTIAGIAMYFHHVTEEHGEQVRTLDEATSMLHYLDTRQAEFKVNAYRAVFEKDVPAIVEELGVDRASAKQAIAAFDALELPSGVEAQFEALKADMAAFDTFIVAFVEEARTNQAGVLAREPEVAALNHAFDAKLTALHESLGKTRSQAVDAMESMDYVADWGIAIALIGGYAAKLLFGISIAFNTMK